MPCPSPPLASRARKRKKTRAAPPAAAAAAPPPPPPPPTTSASASTRTVTTVLLLAVAPALLAQIPSTSALPRRLDLPEPPHDVGVVQAAVEPSFSKWRRRLVYEPQQRQPELEPRQVAGTSRERHPRPWRRDLSYHGTDDESSETLTPDEVDASEELRRLQENWEANRRPVDYAGTSASPADGASGASSSSSSSAKGKAKAWMAGTQSMSGRGHQLGEVWSAVNADNTPVLCRKVPPRPAEEAELQAMASARAKTQREANDEGGAAAGAGAAKATLTDAQETATTVLIDVECWPPPPATRELGYRQIPPFLSSSVGRTGASHKSLGLSPLGLAHRGAARRRASARPSAAQDDEGGDLGAGSADGNDDDDVDDAAAELRDARRLAVDPHMSMRNPLRHGWSKSILDDDARLSVPDERRRPRSESASRWAKDLTRQKWWRWKPGEGYVFGTKKDLDAYTRGPGIALAQLLPPREKPYTSPLPLIPNQTKRDFVVLLVRYILITAVVGFVWEMYRSLREKPRRPVDVALKDRGGKSMPTQVKQIRPLTQAPRRPPGKSEGAAGPSSPVWSSLFSRTVGLVLAKVWRSGFPTMPGRSGTAGDGRVGMQRSPSRNGGTRHVSQHSKHFKASLGSGLKGGAVSALGVARGGGGSHATPDRQSDISIGAGGSTGHAPERRADARLAASEMELVEHGAASDHWTNPDDDDVDAGGRSSSFAAFATARPTFRSVSTDPDASRRSRGGRPRSAGDRSLTSVVVASSSTDNLSTLSSGGGGGGAARGLTGGALGEAATIGRGGARADDAAAEEDDEGEIVDVVVTNRLLDSPSGLRRSRRTLEAGGGGGGVGGGGLHAASDSLDYRIDATTTTTAATMPLTADEALTRASQRGGGLYAGARQTQRPRMPPSGATWNGASKGWARFS